MIEISRRRILLDGRPVLVMAGEIHYFRVARDQWQQRIDLALEAGCTAIASYIPWLWHELPDGSIDVDGHSRPERDVGAFIDLCAANGLHFIARPGPFIMAELKNEGLPYRLYTDHPEIVGSGWDGRPVPTSTVDYLAPAYLAEVQRWYAAVLPPVAARLHTRGGPVIALQLDNEIGMLAWVSNTPDLTDGLLADLLQWCRDVHGEDFAVRYPEPATPDDWRITVASPQEAWAGDLRVDLALFMRNRFGRYTRVLTELAADQGISGIPLLINIHGTEGGNGVPFAIGISQLLDTWAGVPGMVAGSDHYLGDMSIDVTTDMHFLNACQAAVNDADQPLTSLEFEAGTGDYGGGTDRLLDPATVDLKTRLCLAQGNRMINYYLLAGGINPPLDTPVGDGNDRISFTGERHGTAAPIGPEGQRGLTFDATARIGTVAGLQARWLADMDEEHDDLAIAFLPDAFATEYHHPDSAEMTAATDDLARYRGPGPRKALWRSLLLAGYRFGAVNLQDPAAVLPSLVVLASGAYLDGPVQQRLVDHLTGGGRLLHLGALPEKDLRGRPCTTLIDAIGITPGTTVHGGEHSFPSVVATGGLPSIPETRVGLLQEIRISTGSTAQPVLVDLDGRVCGVRAAIGTGSAVLLTAELPSSAAFFAGIAADLGAQPGLRLTTSVPGVVATTTASPDGDRLLHLLNPTGYHADLTVMLDGLDLSGAGWRLPARTGVMLPSGLTIEAGRIRSATGELVGVSATELTFGPSVDPTGHTVVLDTREQVTVDPASSARVTGNHGLVTITDPRGDLPLTVTLGR